MARPAQHGDGPRAQRLLDDLARPGECPEFDPLDHAQDGHRRRDGRGQPFQRRAEIRRSGSPPRSGRRRRRPTAQSERDPDRDPGDDARQVAPVDPARREVAGVVGIARPEPDVRHRPGEQRARAPCPCRPRPAIATVFHRHPMIPRHPALGPPRAVIPSRTPLGRSEFDGSAGPAGRRLSLSIDILSIRFKLDVACSRLATLDRLPATIDRPSLSALLPYEQEENTMADIPPIRVAVSGAAGRIAYSLVFRIFSGGMFGPISPSPSACWMCPRRFPYCRHASWS